MVQKLWQVMNAQLFHQKSQSQHHVYAVGYDFIFKFGVALF
jgi:hypothetical protein